MKNKFNYLLAFSFIGVMLLTLFSSLSVYISNVYCNSTENKTLHVCRDLESKKYADNEECDKQTDTSNDSDSDKVAFPDELSDDKSDNFSIIDMLSVKSEAQTGYFRYQPYKPVKVDQYTTQECSLLKTYIPFIREGLKEFSSKSFPNLNEAIVAGMLYEETHFGLVDMKPKGCGGRGDYRKTKAEGANLGPGYYGHGLGQADPSSENVPKKVTWEPGATVQIKRQGYTYTYRWDDCRQGILYLIAHTFDVAELADKLATAKMKKAGLNVDRFPNGYFKNIETHTAYTVLMLAAHNAGPTGMNSRCNVNSSGVVNEVCTAHGNYSTRVLKSGINAARCLGYVSNINDLVRNVGGN